MNDTVQYLRIRVQYMIPVPVAGRLRLIKSYWEGSVLRPTKLIGRLFTNLTFPRRWEQGLELLYCNTNIPQCFTELDRTKYLWNNNLCTHVCGHERSQTDVQRLLGSRHRT